MSVAVMFALAAIQSAPTPLAAGSAWRAQAGPVTCVVGRSYGTGGERLILQLETSLTAPTYELRVVGPADRLPSMRRGASRMSIRLGSSNPFRAGSYSADLVGGRRMMATFLSFEEAADAMRETSIALTSGSWSISFSLNGFEKAVADLRSCQRDLLVSWGLDPEPWLQQRLARLVGNPGAHFDADTFSPALLAARTSDHLTMVVPVDLDGITGECRVVESAGPALDAAACARLKAVLPKAQPPLDPAGVAIPSYIFVTLRVQ